MHSRTASIICILGLAITAVAKEEVDRRAKAERAASCAAQLETEKLSATAKKKLQAEAVALCSEVQLGSMDLWFGDSVITWCRLLLVDGEWQEAREVLLGQVEILKNIEKTLAEQKLPVSAISPVAGCRYLLGETYNRERANEADADRQIQLAAEALKQFYNVYVKYGDSPWGPASQDRAEEAKAFLESRGKTVKIDLGGNRDRLVANKFKFGARLLQQKKYGEAVEQYLVALNNFPDTVKSVSALRDLGLCWFHLGEQEKTRMVVEYLGERFASNTNTPPAILSLGRAHLDAENKPGATWIYEKFLSLFPGNERAPGVLYSLAGLNPETKEAYLLRTVKTYPASAYGIKALSQLAWAAYGRGEFDAAEKLFGEYVAAEPDYAKRSKAQFARADCGLKSRDWKISRENFQALEKMVRAEEASGELLEKAVFYQGFCRVQDKRSIKTGVQEFDRLLKEFPESALAPRALNEKGLALLRADDFDAAFQALEKLIADFPDSGEARTALAGLIQSAVEQQRFDVAEQVLERMLKNKEAYGLSVYVSTGEGLLEAEEFKLAEKAFAAVPASAERKFAERALYGQAAAQFGLEQFDKSFQTLENLLGKFPNTGFFYEARLMQARSLVRLGKTAEAVAAFGGVVGLAQDEALLYQATFEMGQALADPKEKLAAFQRVVLLADPAKAELQPLIEQSILASLPLCMEQQRWQDAVDNCDQFAQLFPKSDKLPEVGKTRDMAFQRLETKATP